MDKIINICQEKQKLFLIESPGTRPGVARTPQEAASGAKGERFLLHSSKTAKTKLNLQKQIIYDFTKNVNL